MPQVLREYRSMVDRTSDRLRLVKSRQQSMRKCVFARLLLPRMSPTHKPDSLPSSLNTLLKSPNRLTNLLLQRVVR